LAAHAFEGAVRVIKQGVILEVSLVIFPANPEALLQGRRLRRQNFADLSLSGKWGSVSRTPFRSRTVELEYCGLNIGTFPSIGSDHPHTCS